jgi:hypothetical protein
MANVLNGKGGFLGKAAVSAIAAGAIDGAVEVGRVPILNDESNIFPGRSNTEVVLYGAGVIGTVLSAFAMLSKGSRLFGGVGSELLPASLGAITGTYLYENFVAPAVIRK